MKQTKFELKSSSLAPAAASKPIVWFFVGAAAVLAYLSWSSVYVALPESYAVCSHEGDIYTVDESNPSVQCVLVSQDRVIATGTQHHVETIAEEEKIYDLQFFDINSGSIIVPGLADAHAHILEYGLKVQLQLDGSNSISEVIARIKSYLDAHPDIRNDSSRWIEGMGWDQNLWNLKAFPTAFDLSQDPRLQSRLIALRRVDGHALWVSEAVLALIGPLPDTVEGGEIIRDKEGKATGVFLDNAMSLVPFPERTSDQLFDYFQTAMQDALKVGLTSIHDASGEDKYIEFYKKIAEEGKLPVRLYLMRSGPPIQVEHAWDETNPLLNYGRDGRLTMRSVKLFMDGALGSWGAALLAPYSDDNSTSGILTTDPEDMNVIVRRAWEAGWQVNIHAIGDRANKIVLDIFESIETTDNGSVLRRRPRIEHAQIMSLDDLDRSGTLGVITSVQPTHATSDMWYAERRLGPERIKGAYAYRTLLEKSPNNVLPLGSDFPIEGINPLLGFYAAVSRLSENGDSPHGKSGWYSSESLTRAQALKGMTLDAAYASFSESDIGSLQKGKKADLVVLNQNIMQIDISEVLTTKVEATVVDGKLLYGRLNRRHINMRGFLSRVFRLCSQWIHYLFVL